MRGPGLVEFRLFSVARTGTAARTGPVTGVLSFRGAARVLSKSRIQVGAEMNNPNIWLIVFVALTAFALLVQAIVMLTAYFLVRKTINTMQGKINDLETTVLPILTKTRDTLDSVGPKIESIAADVADLTRRAKEEGAELQATAGDILERVQRQTSRVDTMLTSVMDGVEHAGNVVADSVTRPVRQVNAALAAAKAFLTVLATGRRRGQNDHMIADQDMFV